MRVVHVVVRGLRHAIVANDEVRGGSEHLVASAQGALSAGHRHKVVTVRLDREVDLLVKAGRRERVRLVRFIIVGSIVPGLDEAFVVAHMAYFDGVKAATALECFHRDYEYAEVGDGSWIKAKRHLALEVVVPVRVILVPCVVVSVEAPGVADKGALVRTAIVDHREHSEDRVRMTLSNAALVLDLVIAATGCRGAHDVASLVGRIQQIIEIVGVCFCVTCDTV